MPENPEEKKSNLAIYIAYGISFGLFIGVFISLLGSIFDSSFIQIAGGGIGLALGILISALYYSFKNRNREK